MADARLAWLSFPTLKISFFSLTLSIEPVKGIYIESTFTKVKLAQTFSMRYSIGDDRNLNFVFTPGHYTEVICQLF